MKITKTANGKKILLSKMEWESIGLKAGWRKAQVEAPTKAPVKSPTKAPDKKPNKGPFEPPKPKINPNPKAKKKLNNNPGEEELPEVTSFSDVIDRLVRVSQAYEQGALEPVRNFWMNIPQDHPFSKNPILSQYGHNLSREGYEYIVNKMQEGGRPAPADMASAGREVQELMAKIFRLEATHEAQLVEAAKDITAEIWGIDKSQLNAQINQKPEEGGEEQEEGEEAPEREEVPITPDIRNEINKRIMMNTMTQGAAVHAMYSVHHLIAEEINAISPELLALYTRMSGIATHQYYIIDIPAVIQMMQAQLKDSSIGWSHVEHPEEGEEQPPDGVIIDDEGQQAQQKKPEVVAQGICFPVLCQELFKGVMELLSHHGINQNLNENELYTVLKHADRLEDEPWLITVGPALWRKFVSVIPEDANLSEIVMKFNQEEPQKVERIIRSIIQNPQAAKDYFAGLREPEGAPMWQDAEYTEVEDEPKQLPPAKTEDDDDLDDLLKGMMDDDNK